ncbi:hypothetical protein V9T40_007144 [Parthenolecanium corni]|uniref:Uncharacterized protein n=1 Tax=Parthenolecanium corni TaxID=536013 RepID=A0AAN9YAH9_9HEMI
MSHADSKVPVISATTLIQLTVSAHSVRKAYLLAAAVVRDDDHLSPHFYSASADPNPSSTPAAAHSTTSSFAHYMGQRITRPRLAATVVDDGTLFMKSGLGRVYKTYSSQTRSPIPIYDYIKCNNHE